MSSLTTSLGNRVVLGGKIGEGGEGSVYEISGRVGYVAKIYHGKPSLDQVAKIDALTSYSGDQEIAKIAALPLSTLFDGKGEVTGYYMKHFKGCLPVHEVYHPENRKVNASEWDFRHQIALAKNISLGFARLHKAQIVVGDVNENSILVTRDCLARFIDTDSFQVRIGSRLLPCLVGVADYTAPELLGLDFSVAERSFESDCFSLAVLIYQLLVVGRHPFATKDLDRTEAIQKSAFAFRNREVHTKDPIAKIVWGSFPRSLQAYFENAFTEAPPMRPSATSWFRLLSRIGNELTQCKESQLHYFYGNSCPWCRVSAIGVDLYPEAIKPAEASIKYTKVFEKLAARAAKFKVDYRPESLASSFSSFPDPMNVKSAGWIAPNHRNIFDDVKSVGLLSSAVLFGLSVWGCKEALNINKDWFGITLFLAMFYPAFLFVGQVIAKELESNYSVKAGFLKSVQVSLREKLNEFGRWAHEVDDVLTSFPSQNNLFGELDSVAARARASQKQIVAAEKANAKRVAEESLKRIGITPDNFPYVSSRFLGLVKNAGITSAFELAPDRLLSINGIGHVTKDKMMNRRDLLLNRFYDRKNEVLSEEDCRKMSSQYRAEQAKMRAIEEGLKTMNQEIEEAKRELKLSFRKGEEIAGDIARMLKTLSRNGEPTNFYDSLLGELNALKPGELRRRRPLWPSL